MEITIDLPMGNAYIHIGGNSEEVVMLALRRVIKDLKEIDEVEKESE